jgi:hypothetical protein
MKSQDGIPKQVRSYQNQYFWVILIGAAVLFSVGTVYAQVNDLTVRFIRIQQEKVHVQMMEGIAGNPWQYRILADWLIDRVIKLLGEVGVSSSRVSVFIAFRFAQCLLIFLAAGLFYRKLGLPLFANLLGLSILMWSMSLSLYNSDLAFNNFFDIAFYLMAAILIMDLKFIWLPLLMLVAALNRETSALIPFMLLGHVYFHEDRPRLIRPAMLYSIGSLLVFTAILVALRLYYAEQIFLTADGYYPGIGLLVLNLTRIVTWEQFLITFGVVPILAIFAYRAWPRILKTYFWTVVPAWIIIHFFAALVAETRLLLVPQALVFIPGALLGIVEKNEQ